MDGENGSLRSWGVEASGWDAAENFFVEKTSLRWRDNEDEEVQLRSSLEQGAVVFLRLLESGGNDFPIAYRATQIDQPSGDGRSRVRLAPLRRRDTHQEEFERWSRSMRVA
jgi:hypothetical protein